MSACELIGGWIKSITNHLYWCAANAPDGDDIVKQWKSLMNYLCNIHEDCYHDHLHSLTVQIDGSFLEFVTISSDMAV